MKLKNIFVMLMFIMAYKVVIANENDKLYSYGVNGSFLFSKSIANFKSLGNIASCCNENYLGSFSQNYQLSVYYKSKLLNKVNYFVDLGVANYNDVYSNYQQISIKNGYAKVNYVEKLNMFAIQNSFGINYDINKVGLFFGVLTEVSLYSRYDIYEKLVEPLGSKFENGKNIRNDFYNNPASNLNNWNFGLTSSIKYEILLNQKGSKTLSPFLRMDYIFSNYQKVGEFKRFNIYLGISYNYNEYKKLDSPIEPR